ncbi:hypothetical protein J2S46_000088 [Kitasatospora herbaricolor]|uniref:hypothetical protein n=1 Tax=Kitasatospora herbaricolor TaxID=68217 RepID=UPI00174C4A36|nr:hypothetical protein [Kitasatospora herbaricolor]MDQ0305532.1 hypothetical protein [Kitasatospora herbaricolor]
MNIVRAVAWVAATSVVAAVAAEEFEGGALVVAAVVVALAGAWAAAGLLRAGAGWSAVCRAALRRAGEEIVVKSAGLLAEHAVTGEVPGLKALLTVVAVEVLVVLLVRVLRR